MKHHWSWRLALLGGIIMALPIIVFYVSENKTPIRAWVDGIGFPAIWLGVKLFRSAPQSRTADILFNLYVITFTALEGFLVGWGIDFVRNRHAKAD